MSTTDIGSLTIRDWFAVQAMQGLITHSGPFRTKEYIAMDAYEFADEMIRASGREVPTKPTVEKKSVKLEQYELNKTLFFAEHSVITDSDCKTIIGYAKDSLTKLYTLTPDGSDGRIADGTWLDPSLPEVNKIQRKVAEASGLPIENQEGFHVIRYIPGGRYDAHHDFFKPDEDYFSTEMSRGGQRLQSWILYLNDGYVGGGTDFPREGFTVVPRQGLLVGWNDTLGQGILNWDSHHAGLPIESGEKWIAVIWIREGTFNQDFPVSYDWV